MKAKALNIAAYLVGLMMLNSGLNKFFQYMPMPEMSEPAMKAMGALMQVGWIFPLIAFVEILGGVFLFVPKLRTFGACMLIPIIIGIDLFHIFQDPAGLPIAIVITLIIGLILNDNKAKIAAIFE